MHSWWQDLRYGWTGLCSRPGFAVLAFLTLALGLGAATTIFSVIQNVLLDPYPYTDAERLAMIQIHDATINRPGGRTAFQVPEFLEYQEQNRVFEEIIGGGKEDVLHGFAAGSRCSCIGGEIFCATRSAFVARRSSGCCSVTTFVVPDARGDRAPHPA